MNGRNYETLDFRIESLTVPPKLELAKDILDESLLKILNEFFIRVEMRIQWVVWAPGREPLTKMFDWLSGGLPVETKADHESTMGSMMIVTWTLPVTLAQYLYDRFRYDPQSNVSDLKKYLDLKRGEK